MFLSQSSPRRPWGSWATWPSCSWVSPTRPRAPSSPLSSPSSPSSSSRSSGSRPPTPASIQVLDFVALWLCVLYYILISVLSTFPTSFHHTHTHASACSFTHQIIVRAQEQMHRCDEFPFMILSTWACVGRADCCWIKSDRSVSTGRWNWMKNPWAEP